MHWKDALARGLRVFLFAFLSALLTMWGQASLAPGELPDWDWAKRTLVAAALAGVTAVVTAAINLLEDNTGVAVVYKDNQAIRMARAKHLTSQVGSPSSHGSNLGGPRGPVR